MALRLIVLPAMLALAAGQQAGAQAWTAGQFDNGAWFEATAIAPGGQVMLHCGGVSPAGGRLPESDEPMLTAPGMLELSIALPGVADLSQGYLPPRGDLAIVIGSTGYRLPQADWDVINGRGWTVPVPVAEPWLQALRGAPAFAIDSAGGRQGVISAAGAAAALDAVIAHCTARWQAPPAGSATTERLLAGVEAAIAATCGGPSRRNPGYVMQAELDGDGQPDLMLLWIENECLTPVGLGMCAPSQCPIDLFLSSKGGTPAPESIMGNLVGIVPRNGAGAAIRVTSPPNCNRAADPGQCQFDWIWDGRNMTVLP
jgi:hypothetical protein